jgi:hypothetical protein
MTPDWPSHRHHGHKGQQSIARQRKAALSGSVDPVPKMLRNEVVASCHVGNHHTRRKRCSITSFARGRPVGSKEPDTFVGLRGAALLVAGFNLGNAASAQQLV